MTIGGSRLPDYLTVEETANALDYHADSVRRLIRQGRLKADKKGTMWLVYREAVEQYRQAIAGKAKHDPTRGN
jgi:excisionase family DNA binding protein